MVQRSKPNTKGQRLRIRINGEIGQRLRQEAYLKGISVALHAENIFLQYFNETCTIEQRIRARYIPKATKPLDKPAK